MNGGKSLILRLAGMGALTDTSTLSLAFLGRKGGVHPLTAPSFASLLSLSPPSPRLGLQDSPGLYSRRDPPSAAAACGRSARSQYQGTRGARAPSLETRGVTWAHGVFEAAPWTQVPGHI